MDRVFSVAGMLYLVVSGRNVEIRTEIFTEPHSVTVDKWKNFK